MDHFELVSEYKPTGDQPQAIEALVEGFKEARGLSFRLRCSVPRMLTQTASQRTGSA